MGDEKLRNLTRKSAADPYNKPIRRALEAEWLRTRTRFPLTIRFHYTEKDPRGYFNSGNIGVFPADRKDPTQWDLAAAKDYAYQHQFPRGVTYPDSWVVWLPPGQLWGLRVDFIDYEVVNNWAIELDNPTVVSVILVFNDDEEIV